MSVAIEHAGAPAVVRVIELVGVSSKSWSDAAQQVVSCALGNHPPHYRCGRAEKLRGRPGWQDRRVSRGREAGVHRGKRGDRNGLEGQTVPSGAEKRLGDFTAKHDPAPASLCSSNASKGDAMTIRMKPFHALTAGDLMTGPVQAIRRDRSLREAAEVLRRADVTGGPPVADEEERCVGVLFGHRLRSLVQHPGLPVDWPSLIEALPADEVGRFMTADPVMTSPTTPLADVARMMIDAHLHRVIVVDGNTAGRSASSAARTLSQRCPGPAADPMRSSMPRTILHPTDFSEAAEAAFRVACAVARKDDSRLIILHVYPPPICHGEVVARRQPDSYENDLWRLLEQYQAADGAVHVEHRLVEGDVADEIFRLAKEEGCDLIVMGTQGRTGLPRLLLGSVAEQVLRTVVLSRPHRPAARRRNRRATDSGGAGAGEEVRNLPAPGESGRSQPCSATVKKRRFASPRN